MVYIKLIAICLGLVVLLAPNTAYEKTISEIPDAIHRPSDELVEQGRLEYEATQAKLKRSQTKSLAKGACPYPDQCVCYAKQLTGHYGVWGNGGWSLSANSGPVVGAVIIFRNMHVGVITAFDGYRITYTDRNGLGDRRIRLEVVTTINNPLIWKYHKF